MCLRISTGRERTEADVISRIEASNAGQKEELRKSICEQLAAGFHKLTDGKERKVSRMVIGGNSTMHPSADGIFL